MKKNYVIIGGSTGIGLSLVKSLSKEKENSIYVFSRTEKELKKYDNVYHYPLDVLSSPIEWPNTLTETVDGLAYFPGNIRLKPFSSISSDEYLEDLKLNLFGAINAIQRFFPNIKKGRGSIVLISTIAAKIGLPFHTSIAASKGALEGFALSLAAEVAPFVRVNVIAPSLVRTSLSEKFISTEEKLSTTAKRHALQRIGEPEEIAAMAEYLMSSAASWITGQIFHIDGGMSSLKTS